MRLWWVEWRTEGERTITFIGRWFHSSELFHSYSNWEQKCKISSNVFRCWKITGSRGFFVFWRRKDCNFWLLCLQYRPARDSLHDLSRDNRLTMKDVGIWLFVGRVVDVGTERGYRRLLHFWINESPSTYTIILFNQWIMRSWLSCSNMDAGNLYHFFKLFIRQH